MTLQARYTILRKIADGGTAEIFLATQHGAHGFEKPVVLKRIFPAFYADPQFRNMLVDEAHIAMSLNHSNIVQVLDLGEAEGQYVLALELVDGWSLDAVLRRARALNTTIPPALALYTAAEVCRALAYAHSKSSADGQPLGIVHRDASPHNVLLSEQGEVKLTDFGIAKAQNRREISLGNMIKGKIAYMSPEQASGGVLDARSDLFSVGTMLYVMICRRYPFDAPTDLEVLLLVKAGEYVAPETARPGLNPELYRVLNRAMAKDPDDRYQRAEEMLVDFEQVMRVAFRAVGQTELKRWLQDLSMRDGVPPLTRAPAPPTGTSGIAGQVEGEILELHGVGETPMPTPLPTLPPPGPSASHSSSRPNHPVPAVGSGPLGKSRPPPPPAAMLVGKKSGSHPILAPLAPRLPAPPEIPLPLTPLPTTLEETAQVIEEPPLAEAPPAASTAASTQSAEITELPSLASTGEPALTPVPHDPVGGAEVPQVPPVHADTAAPDDLSAGNERTDQTASRPDVLESAVPMTPRRSSSWVAEAVLASAQRAGTAPPPPVGPAVPPPPVALPIPVAAADVPSAPATPETPAPSKGPRRAMTVALGVVAVLVVGFSLKVCGGGSQSARQAASLRRAKQAGQVAATTAAARDASATLATSTSAAAGPGTSARDASAGTTDPAVAGSAPAAAVGVAVVAENAPGTAISGIDPKAAAAPGATTSATTAAAAAADGGTSAENADQEPDAGTDPDGGATAHAPRVLVLLKSTPSGAQVGTARRSFGSTPVSAKLRVGRTYALTFTREGYRPVTKQFRVTNFADQQVNAMLRRAAPGTASPEPITPQAPTAKPVERNWFQRMFGR